MVSDVKLPRTQAARVQAVSDSRKQRLQGGERREIKERKWGPLCICSDGQGWGGLLSLL